MRNMSFALTTKQFKDGSKNVTRRLGWANLKVNEHFSAVEKSQGLRKGEKIKHLGQCICISNEPEPLFHIEKNPVRGYLVRTEVEREGFPDLTPRQFIEMFCKEMKCYPVTVVRRIEFDRI